MKYCKLLRFLLLTLIVTLKFTFLSAQSIDQITGVWKVEDVSILEKLSADEQQAIKVIKDALQKATFTFKANHQAIVYSENAEIRIDNGYWEYSPAKKLITITEWKDRFKERKGLLMGIIVKSEGDGKTFFYLEETPIKLKVRK